MVGPVGWTPQGLQLGPPWSWAGCPMGRGWVPRGQGLVVPWTWVGCPMGKDWVSHGEALGAPWIRAPMDVEGLRWGHIRGGGTKETWRGSTMDACGGPGVVGTRWTWRGLNGDML